MTDAIIVAARACLNTPFRHQGRLPGIALDCAGLVVAVAQAIGADYRDEQGYSRQPHRGRLKAALDTQPCLAPIAAPEKGCVLLLRFEREPQHLAIYTGETIIHAYERVGKVCEHRWPDGVSFLVQSYRFVGVKDE